MLQNGNSLLGLSQSVLDIIEHDHRSAIDCCIKMWTKWLDTDTTATWRTVLNALDHEAVTETEKSNHHLHMYMYVLQQVEWLCFATINMCASFIRMYHTLYYVLASPISPSMHLSWLIAEMYITCVVTCF